MSPWLKFLIGLAAALLLGWVHHGPIGGGERLIDRLEREAKAVVAATEVPGVEVRLQRNPLARKAILSGTADEFQREGQGEFPGINDRVNAVKGISGLRWEDPLPEEN